MTKGKILVTGGTGYIGSHTVCQLLTEGYDVISVDNLSNSFEDVNVRIEQITSKKVTFIQADLCNKFIVQTLFNEHTNIEGIIHFAAFKSVSESVEQPLKYYENNIQSLINLLDVVCHKNIKSFVFSSSCTVYGQPPKLPVSETSPVQKPFSPYGNTKKIAEEILQDFSNCYPDVKISILRYFNPIGAHPSGLIGELPLGIPNNLMPYITQTAYGLRKQLHIFGGDYNTPDGTAIRDFIHVMDIADAHLSALDRILKNKAKQNIEIYNLGTGKGYSVLQIVQTFIRITGIDVPFQITDRREGDIEQIWADPTLANVELGWKTNRTLEDMITDSWKWENYFRKTIKQPLK